TVLTHSESWDTKSDLYKSLTYEDVKKLVRSHSGSSIMVMNPIFVGSTVFGHYGVLTDDIVGYAHKIKRITKAINISFNEMYNRMKQAEMRMKAEKAAYTNQVTGLPNLRGSCKWFNDFSASEENRKKSVSVSVYALAKYKYILENYGISDVENCIVFIGEALKSSNPHNCFIGQISEYEFVIINYFDENEDIGKVINSATSNFFPLMDNFNKTNGKDYFAEVNCGCTVVNPGWSGTLASFIKFASAELYMNKLRMNTERRQGSESKESVDNEKFALLIEQNMFRYCFQPIVDAKTGEIFAYEALMRTTDSINMSPLEVLHAAAQNNRLYDIERATVFNIMEHYAHNSDVFGNCKVFINLIPGYFLNEADYKIIGAKYGDMMDNFVFEITEQNTVSDSELERIKKLGGEYRSNPVAVDDYGTGHSNIVNLLRYSPQIIKIDRFLISGCDTDVNKQMFIKSTVEFARLNGIKVLAEGVETSEELKTAVSFGVDYIQGYYTGKPVFDPISEIKDTIREEILD
ncbi:MAG: EAL domain-containing protein, partial [Huintestinicola sp.]